MTKHHHFKIYKPAGYLSQFVNNQNQRKNKKLLGELGQFPEGIMAVGRLDEYSEGLLFLTTDGKVSNAVLSKNIEKEYFVQVHGHISDEAIIRMQNGIEIKVNQQTYCTLPATVQVLKSEPELPPSPRQKRDLDKVTSWISITICEGKYRQIRKMTAAVGFPTLRLIRVRIGHELIDNLIPGQFVELKAFDLGNLKT